MGAVVHGVRLKLSGQVDTDASRARSSRRSSACGRSARRAHVVYSQGDLSVVHVERHLGPEYVALLEAAACRWT